MTAKGSWARCFVLPALLLAGLASGCGEDAVGPDAGGNLVLRVDGLLPLDPDVDGVYEAWVLGGGDGASRSAGRFSGPTGGEVELVNPVDDPAAVWISVEPPGDDDSTPSESVLLGGEFRGREAELTIKGNVTPGADLDLMESPGTHVLFSPSNNHEEGFPSDEDAGIWLFNLRVRKPMRDSDLCSPETGRSMDEWAESDFFLDFMPLTSGWVYEGWVVRDLGTPREIWLSYGKLHVSGSAKANAQDDTGFGPFSGWEDYVDAQLPRLHCFPGDDWVANPFGLDLPGDLELPLDLNGRVDGEGEVVAPSRWTHVISIEPSFNVEPEGPDAGPGAILGARPFTIRPYRNAIGEAGADVPRTIEFHPDGVPSGTAHLK